MKKPLILALTLISTSLQAQTYNQVQWGINKASSPYPVSVNVNNVWGQLGTLSAAGQWAIPTSNIVGPCGLSIFACANTWTALQTFTTTRIGPAVTIPAWFDPITSSISVNYPASAKSSDTFRVDIGGFPVSNEYYGYAPRPNPNINGNQAVVGTILTPASATCSPSQACADNAIAGYAQTNSPSRPAVAIFGESGISVDGANPYGANIVAINCKNHDISCVPGNAYNVNQANGAEADVVVFDTPTGTPTGNFYGFQAILNRGGGVGQTTSVAFSANGFNGSPWLTGFQCAGGGTSGNCFSLGPTSKTGTSLNSQNIVFTSINASGAPISNTIYQNSVGAFQFNSVSGGYTYQIATSYPQLNFIGGSNASVGEKIATSATTGAVASYILQTGTAGNSMSANLFNSGVMRYTAGSNVSNLQFQMGAGATNVLSLTPTSATFTVPTTLGVNATTTGQLTLANGNALGSSVTIQNIGATASYNFNLPATVGSATYLLTSQGGGSSDMTWTSPTVTVNGTGCTLGSSCTVTAASSSIPFPITVSGTVTSGGIPYFNSTTQMSSSSVLAANALMIGGGAGVAPSTTTTGTGVVTAIGNTTNSAGGLVTFSGNIGAATGTSLALGTTLTSGQVLTVSGNTATSGYLYSGATSAPTNTTAGDITATRLSIGNTALSTSLIRISGNIGTGATSFGMYYDPTATSAGNLTNVYGMYILPSVNMTGGAGSNTITNLANYAAGQSVITAGNVTSTYGFWAQSTLVRATNNYGFYCDINSGTVTNFCYYSANTATANAFAGKTAFGSTTYPTYNVDVTGDINSTANYRVAGKVSVSATAPTISSGFGTSPSISANNGTSAFRVNVGTGGTATSGVIGLPTASTGWNCFASDFTTPATKHVIKMTASTTTTATLTNYDVTTGTAAAWAASDIIIVNCMAY